MYADETDGLPEGKLGPRLTKTLADLFDDAAAEKGEPILSATLAPRFGDIWLRYRDTQPEPHQDVYGRPLSWSEARTRLAAMSDRDLHVSVYAWSENWVYLFEKDDEFGLFWVRAIPRHPREGWPVTPKENPCA